MTTYPQVSSFCHLYPMRNVSYSIRLIHSAVLFLSLPVVMEAQAPTVAEVLRKSIAYHDPHGEWGRFAGTFSIRMETPEKPDRLSHIHIDQPHSYFGIRMVQEGVETELVLDRGDCQLRYNGSAAFSDDIAEKYRLTCDRARFWRDYYSFLYGLPMKLSDPGTRIDPKVERRSLRGSQYWVLKVTYEPDTGSDTWYFYFNPQSFSLAAYQFFHNPARNDGEYILLEGEALIGKMRLPRIRKWYTNQADAHLGTDFLFGGE